MEKLKSLVPDSLKRMVAESTPDSLPRTCSSLLNFFSDMELFHQALRLAPVDVDDMDKNLVAALYVNRASVLHKLDLLMEGRRDCNRALQISPSYAKAWYRRGKMNASLGNFEDAVHDLNIAKNLELSFGGQRQIESELRIITDMFERTESSLVQHKENELDLLDEPDQIKLKCVITPNKGRGMVAPSDIPPASLVHAEEPYALIVILISQIRVNSMTIFRMKSADVNGPLHQFGKFSHSEVSLTSNVEQVKVGQAIYRVGSLFNHSCQPNIGAYFVSRSLFIRTTEFVAVGCPLELSYGPQAGQWDCKDRLKFLKDEYSFRCECRACAEVNLSDLVLNAFHCVSPNCPGIVLDSCVVNCEKQKTRHVQSATGISTLEPFMQVDMLKCLPSNGSLRIDPGFCLKCDSYCDLESSFAAVNRAWISITRSIPGHPALHHHRHHLPELDMEEDKKTNKKNESNTQFWKSSMVRITLSLDMNL